MNVCMTRCVESKTCWSTVLVTQKKSRYSSERTLHFELFFVFQKQRLFEGVCERRVHLFRCFVLFYFLLHAFQFISLCLYLQKKALLF